MRQSIRRSLAVSAAIALAAGAAGCGWHASISAPLTPPGQISEQYRLPPGRALLIGRIDVTTNGTPGFGAATNPMFVEFEKGEGLRAGESQTLSIADPRDRFFTSEARLPALWRYTPPGLLALAVAPGAYDAMVIGYPDMLRVDRPADSIPTPSGPMVFAPVQIAPDTITYIGDIHVRQTIGWTDLMLDRVRIEYAVADRYDDTLAQFRARYPQFAQTAVEKRLIAPVANDA
jgi:hypothetical protein